MPPIDTQGAKIVRGKRVKRKPVYGPPAPKPKKKPVYGPPAPKPNPLSAPPAPSPKPRPPRAPTPAETMRSQANVRRDRPAPTPKKPKPVYEPPTPKPRRPENTIAAVERFKRSKKYGEALVAAQVAKDVQDRLAKARTAPDYQPKVLGIPSYRKTKA